MHQVIIISRKQFSFTFMQKLPQNCIKVLVLIRALIRKIFFGYSIGSTIQQYETMSHDVGGLDSAH